MQKKVQEALLNLARRADQQDQSILNNAFVNIGNLYANLSSKDHQVIFGRRGTGKTHILRYFQDKKTVEGDLAIYIDMRNMGSETSIYCDPRYKRTDRARRLILDVFNAIVNNLLDAVFSKNDFNEKIFDFIDALQQQITSIIVIESKTIEETKETSENASSVLQLGLTSKGPTAGTSCGRDSKFLSQSKTQYTEKEEIKVVFSGIAPAFNNVANALTENRIWILLDEWAAIPSELQPILSDLIRRTLLTCHKISVKIGAIEVGSKFSEKQNNSDYIGIELGADMQADISLDDFMVFENDREKAEHFFAELFRKHLVAIDNSLNFKTYDEFITKCFTQKNSFSELVRAAEGVPRDAINILRNASMKFSGEKFSIPAIRSAARTWYDRDKSANISETDKLLLQWIIDNVIKEKKARGFLLSQLQYGKRQDINSLVNNRVLHIIKRSISAKDNPGVRYDVYLIDYGCYVDLLTTQLAPQDIDHNISYMIDVPYEDYRSLRRAILDIEKFDDSLKAKAQEFTYQPISMI